MSDYIYMADKIINTFQTRRQLENEIGGFTELSNEREIIEHSRQIIRSYSPDLIRTTLTKHLDHADNQLRGGLGHLATLLPPDEVVPALQAVAADRKRNPQARMNAVSILERYLGEDVSPNAVADISDVNDLAFQSLCDAIEEARVNRHILLEYVTQMREEEEDVAYLVVDHLARLPERDQIELLRLIAQDDRPSVAHYALRQLEALSPNEVGEQLAYTLHTLQSTLGPDLAEKVERQLRKLRFSGTRYEPVSSRNWRALLGPAECGGNQFIWFVYAPNADSQDEKNFGIILSLVINQFMGVIHTSANEQMEVTKLPKPCQIGELLSIQGNQNQSIVLLEAPFDYGRWLVKKALTVHWADRAWQPLFGEYTLYNDLLWQFAPPQIDDELEQIWQDLPLDTIKETDLELASQRLLEHLVMSSWQFDVALFLRPLWDTIILDQDQPIIEQTTELLRQFIQHQQSHDVLLSIQAGLQAQAGWLQISGSSKIAKYAQMMAESLIKIPAQHHPFLLQLFGQVVAQRKN
ncbi:hypothetical protein KFU94_04735 [Chloroflexi bacterium TSY]|nr:hypothetical protein [Chloroflexi bacterium TSY]